MSKEAIITSVNNSLAQNKLAGADTGYKDMIKRDNSDIFAEYVAMQSANKAIIKESSDIVSDIKAILKEIGAQKVIYSLDLASKLGALKGDFDIKPYDKSVDEARDELFGIDTSIVTAKCGIADIGVFGVASSKDSPRLASLITKNCIAILDKNLIVQSLIDGVNLLKSKSEILPSNMILIAGPSRTADIELKTVFGVHGPQQVFVLLV